MDQFFHSLGISDRIERMLTSLYKDTRGSKNFGHFNLCCICFPGSGNHSLIFLWGTSLFLVLSLCDSDKTDSTHLALVWGL